MIPELAALLGPDAAEVARFGNHNRKFLFQLQKHRASRLLDQLRVLFRLSRDLKLISNRKHEHVSGRMAEIGRMLGGWIRAGSGE